VTGTAREALIAEALGELASLLDRIEAATPAIEAASQALADASAALEGQVAAAECRVTTLADGATVQAIRQMARRSEELARAAAESETEAMRVAARELFRSELAPALQRCAQSLERRASRRLWRAGAWWTHALAAVAAAALTLAVVPSAWWH
jgi:hypothetical protein